MAWFKRKAKQDPWAAEVQAVQERNNLVQTLTELDTPDARKQLRKMRDVLYDTDAPISSKDWFMPGGQRTARGSSGKADRINSGLRAKQRVPK